MTEKPFTLHYTDYRKVMGRMPKNAVILHNHPGFWMVVRLPGMTWDQVTSYFKDDAVVGICEQKEYCEDAKKESEPHKVDAAFPLPAGCGKHGCVV